MRDLHDPHQSRCARQLCLRHASSPQGKLKNHSCARHLRLRHASCARQLCLRHTSSPIFAVLDLFNLPRGKVPAGRMRVFFMTLNSLVALANAGTQAIPQGKLKNLCSLFLSPSLGKVPVGRMRIYMTLISLVAFASFAFGTRCPQGWRRNGSYFRRRSRLFRRVEERNPTYELSHGRSILE